MSCFPSWPDLARQSAQALPLRLWQPEVVDYLTSKPASPPWAVACSGGADSVYLLLSLLAGFPEKRPDIHVLHFNHQLRGKESDADATFVRRMAQDLGITFHYGEWQRDTTMPVNEATAREARHTFIRGKLAALGGRIVLFGHQRDDIAEQFLMRLARGSGTAGLAGPRPIQHFRDQRVYLRPLLGLSRKIIREKLQELGAPWREDSSNDSDTFLRNRIRKYVLPAWQNASTHDVDCGTAQSRRLLDEDDQALQVWLDTLLPQQPGEKTWDISALRGKPQALVRRALYRWFTAQRPAIMLSRPALDRFLQAVMENRPVRMSAGPATWIAHDNGRLERLQKLSTFTWMAAKLVTGTLLFLPHGACLSATAIRLSEPQRQAILAGAVDQHCQGWLRLTQPRGTPFIIRPWQSGDRYRPLGSPGHTLLQDSFTNRKITPAERRRLPLVCDIAGAILWCPYLPPAESYKIDEQTAWAVRLTYTPSIEKLLQASGTQAS